MHPGPDSALQHQPCMGTAVAAREHALSAVTGVTAATPLVCRHPPPPHPPHPPTPRRGIPDPVAVPHIGEDISTPTTQKVVGCAVVGYRTLSHHDSSLTIPAHTQPRPCTVCRKQTQGCTEAATQSEWPTRARRPSVGTEPNEDGLPHEPLGMLKAGDHCQWFEVDTLVC